MGPLRVRFVLLSWPLLAIGFQAAAWGQIVNIPATTVQLPVLGVSIDAEGVLQARQFAPPGGELHLQRALAAQIVMPPPLFAKSELRKISLTRLEAAIKRRVDAGGEPTDEMNKLAGLLRLQYVFVYPDTGDVVIAGQAEGWIQDASGRAVGITTGRPVVLLEDLLTAMRTFAPGRPPDTWVGCTIDPTADGLQRLNEFQQTIPSRVPQSAEAEVAAIMVAGLRDSLGMANIRVFSISGRTNMAQVLIEADYRMKLIGIGLEAPPIEMPTFFSMLKTAPPNTFQRWWFTPNYQCVRVAQDNLAMELVGQGVQLLTEDYLTDDRGRLQKVNVQPSGASKRYAETFTRQFPEIAAASPVFAQLRNMIDLLVAAAFMQQENVFQKTGWQPTAFFDEKQLPVMDRPEPMQCPCAANAAWKGNRLIAPSGGGVSISAAEALKPQNIIRDRQSELADAYGQLGQLPEDSETWWWD